MADLKDLRLAIGEFYTNPYYWGGITRYEAETVLKKQPNGSYLLKDPEEKDDKQYLAELAVKIDSKCYFGIKIGTTTAEIEDLSQTELHIKGPNHLPYLHGRSLLLSKHSKQTLSSFSI